MSLNKIIPNSNSQRSPFFLAQEIVRLIFQNDGNIQSLRLIWLKKNLSRLPSRVSQAERRILKVKRDFQNWYINFMRGDN